MSRSFGQITVGKINCKKNPIFCNAFLRNCAALQCYSPPDETFSDEIEHVVSGGGVVDGTPPGSFLPFRAAGCVTKQQLSGLSGQAACEEDRGDFRILFQEV